jgi:cell division protein FtsW (lipid II flippase)
MILFAACAVFVLCVDLVYEHVLQPHQRDRIDIILGKMEDPKGKGYNLNQSKIAIDLAASRQRLLTGNGRQNTTLYLSRVRTLFSAPLEKSGDLLDRLPYC